MSLTQQLIEEIYAPLVKGDWATFFENVKDDVQWTVGNPRLKTFPVAGVYDKKGFQEAFKPLSACFDTPLALTTERIHVAQDGKTVIVELRAQNHAKDGTNFDNMYAWVNEFDLSGDKPVIAVLRAYLDTALVQTVMKSNGAA